MFKPDWKNIPYFVSLLLLAAIAVTLTSVSFDTQWLRGMLTIAPDGAAGMAGLSHLYAGEFWRLFTPLLIHVSLLHLLLNVWWVWELGAELERRKGAFYVIVLILTLAAITNLSQYLSTGPHFGGLSGVAYGLLGFFIAVRFLKSPNALWMNMTMAVVMLVWYVFGVAGLLGEVANMAHSAGLISGILLGAWFAFSGRVLRQ